MTSPISHVTGQTWLGSSGSYGDGDFVSVSSSTDIPSQLWLRGFHLACAGVSNFSSGGITFEVWDGDDGSKKFELGIGFFCCPTSMIMPEDSYIDIVDGLYVRSVGASFGGIPIIRSCYLTVFYTA